MLEAVLLLFASVLAVDCVRVCVRVVACVLLVLSLAALEIVLRELAESVFVLSLCALLVALLVLLSELVRVVFWLFVLALLVASVLLAISRCDLLVFVLLVLFCCAGSVDAGLHSSAGHSCGMQGT